MQDAECYNNRSVLKTVQIKMAKIELPWKHPETQKANFRLIEILKKSKRKPNF